MTSDFDSDTAYLEDWPARTAEETTGAAVCPCCGDNRVECDCYGTTHEECGQCPEHCDCYGE